MNKQIFGRGMTILAAAYPDYALKDETLETYWGFLRHMDDQDFEQAIKNHVRTCKWFPKVSELLQAAEDLRPKPPSAIDAWNMLIVAAPSGKEPEMDHATRKAMDFIGGWDAICYTPTDQHRFIFAQFKLAYIEAQERERKADILISMAREQAALPGD